MSHLPSQPSIHYVLSTHWDREWYLPFQEFRYQLVELLDSVIAGFESGELVGPFTLDGQSILLEDYLEVRPERTDVVKQLMGTGKLVAGPWYVQPDEFLVSGESHLRNLRLGRQLARDLGGKPSQAGFICDQFGHISQLPQIFAGFGIRFAFLWRGTNLIDKRLLRWRGADGTEVAAYRFGVNGYTFYSAKVKHADQHSRRLAPEEIAAALKEFIENEEKAVECGPVLLFDGGDHLAWDKDAYQAIRARADIRHTSLDAYLEEMLPHAPEISTLLQGELREPARHPAQLCQQWLIPGVLSSRVWIKQLNADCQALLCSWAEPFSAAAAYWTGTEIGRGFLEVAWKWLLQNQPHDSIGGCSVDEVHENMKYRFSQCLQIAERVAKESLKHIALSATEAPNDAELRVVVFNPMAQPFDEIASLDLEISSGWHSFNEFFGYESKPAFRIFDHEGNEVAYQRLNQENHRQKLRTFATKFPKGDQVHRVCVALKLAIPALGYQTLTIRDEKGGLPTRHPVKPGLATSERSMANEYLSVTIESNGTITLYDRKSNQTYSRLLTFEDSADIGDGWFHGPAVNDQIWVSSACSADVALVSDGPLLAAFRIRTRMQVPACFDFRAMRRSEESVQITIDSTITLRQGARHLEIQTRVQNTACDHRLRVLFPSGAKTSTYLSDSAFDLVERAIALRGDNHTYRELEVETKPQQTWTAVADAERGLAVISHGLLETAIQDLPERPLALTLFRGTRRTVFTDGESGGQLQGPLEFRYWITPFARDENRTELFHLGQRLAAGLRWVGLVPMDYSGMEQRRRITPSGSLLDVRGPAVTTSLRCVKGEIELRIFNPLDEPGAVQLLSDFAMVQPVDFESNPTGSPIKPGDLTLRPKQILTLRLVTKTIDDDNLR